MIGNEDALALPIPLLPYIPEGAKDDIFHPCLVNQNPRDCDIVLIDSNNFHDAGNLVQKAAGFAIDLDSLPDSQRNKNIPTNVNGRCIIWLNQRH